MDENKTYLGDGAYASFDGYGITLTTENGVSVTNEIYLEPEVYQALTRFVERLRAAASTIPPRTFAEEQQRAVGDVGASANG